AWIIVHHGDGGGAHALEMMDRSALKRLMPITASMLMHVGIVAVVVLGPGWARVRMPVLIAELVDEAPRAIEPAPAPPVPRPVVRDRRPITPPKPIATPMPSEPAAPVRPEPEAPKPAAPEPPAVAAPEPRASDPTPSAPAKTPSPAISGES